MSTKISKWPAGTPMWVDLSVDDVEAAKTFYTGLFGWEYLSADDDAGYLLAQLNGHAIAGLGPKDDPAMPSAWTTFMASDDVNATAERIRESGGQVLMAPFDVMDSGRMAIAADATGAVFGVWQAGNHIGAERVNEHGSLCWNELHTSDYAEARAFYAGVFGFTYHEVTGADMVYATCLRDSDRREVAGIHHDTQIPQSDPAYWLTWFASDDVALTAARAQELGATLLVPVSDTPFGRMVIVEAPQGDVFGVIAVVPATTE
ncbi:VOC family protein [Paenarthrobacter ureafaciens]|uniref:VOC family protein n=1 Tax=Paenarthrobacter ureafaciens TaxID=37931 RepID=UPI001916FDA1|nr:VOC family protein [Paenarthrobacter ureafaciens]QQQ62171.1 VOC family protein [Paenarthrobacter ureafaciens]UOD81144.1 VOC family protein [Paenarthrobacter ureafaciens]WNZ03804.1 VOC family protein [Paenarthrobacter ureafaciens]